MSCDEPLNILVDAFIGLSIGHRIDVWSDVDRVLVAVSDCGRILNMTQQRTAESETLTVSEVKR
jgi:hypothetical protein